LLALVCLSKIHVEYFGYICGTSSSFIWPVPIWYHIPCHKVVVGHKDIHVYG